MRATFECEQCFQEYDHLDDFVQCHGDACHEEICLDNCAKKCPNPECKYYVCADCSRSTYCGNYCIDCAIWDTWDDEDKNFDYAARGMTRKQGLEFLKAEDVRRQKERDAEEAEELSD